MAAVEMQAGKQRGEYSQVVAELRLCRVPADVEICLTVWLEYDEDLDG